MCLPWATSQGTDPFQPSHQQNTDGDSQLEMVFRHLARFEGEQGHQPRNTEEREIYSICQVGPKVVYVNHHNHECFNCNWFKGTAQLYHVNE